MGERPTPSPEKAEIIGLLCAEGTHYKYTCTYKEFSKLRGKRYWRTKTIEMVEFTNLNKHLLEHFRGLMTAVYNYAPQPTGPPTSRKIKIAKRAVMEDLLADTDFGCLKWKVPASLFGAQNNVKASFIRGIFDGDGYVGPSYLRLKSVNENGLKQVTRLLHSLGIACYEKGPYYQQGNRKPYYYIYVPREGALKYKEVISSRHEGKRARLHMLGKRKLGFLGNPRPNGRAV